MKKILNIIFITFVVLFSAILNINAQNSDYIITAEFLNSTIKLIEINGEQTLFLPSGADLNNLTFNIDGVKEFEIEGDKGIIIAESHEPVNVNSIAKNNSFGEYKIKIKINDYVIDFKILCSDKISSLFIKSDDPVNYGRDYVAEVRGNKSKGNIDVYSDAGDIIYSGAMKEIKGRGNSTWEGTSKKPYQIKLDENINLLDDGKDENADKTWILLANSFDPTLIRNQLTYDLAKEVGLPYSPECTPVDVFYDGEYIGNYLLSEKNEISSGRVNINDFEQEIESVGLPEKISYGKDKNIYGNTFKYAEGIVVPDYADYGFLLEYEYPDRVDEEKCWFSTTNGNYVVIKSPENLPKSLVRKVSERYQEYEDAVYNYGVNPNNGRPYEDYVNIDSLVKIFAIEQFSKDIDAFMSSTYMYMDNNMEFNYGPVWDFDISYGIGSNTEADENQKVTGFTVFNTDFSKKLMNIPTFQERYIKFYNNHFAPIIENIILGKTSGKYVRSVDDYVTDVANSQKMNYLIWDFGGFSGNKVDWVFDDYYENVDYLKNFIKDRNEWTKKALNENICLNDIKTLNIYTYFDSISQETYFSLSENDYYVAKILSVENGNIIIKHLSGIEYSDQFEVYINGIRTNYTIDNAECIVVPIPAEHNVMPLKKEGVVFKDVPNNSWYYHYVYNVYNNGWMKGVTDKRFQPEESLKKGMVITALFRMSGSKGDVNKFTVSSECYNDAATWAVKNHIISEFEKEFMEFNGTITREETAVLIYRAYGSPEVRFDLHFVDSSDISDYSVDAVKWCVKNGIFSGDNKNRFNPEKDLSRAELTKILSVYAQLVK